MAPGISDGDWRDLWQASRQMAHPFNSQNSPDFQDSPDSTDPLTLITPAMQVVLQQMLHCPHHGATRQMYLESKFVELLTLWLAQVEDQGGADRPIADRSLPMKGSDLDRIYQARDILLQRFQTPPSLTDLARQVGLNDCTLKRQFKQVFGKTVFGYLHDYRMEQARRWLLDRQWSVTEVARRVGYTNLCAFSTAFRKKFGLSPRSFQRQS